jgi:PAS domain S-box-containing protein
MREAISPGNIWRRSAGRTKVAAPLACAALALLFGVAALEAGRGLLYTSPGEQHSQVLTFAVATFAAACSALAALWQRERLRAARGNEGCMAAEAALRASDEALQRSLDTARMGTWDLDTRTGEARWSRTFEQLAGLAPYTFGGTRAAFLEAIHADDREAVNAAFERALTLREDFSVEHRIVKPNGAARWLETRGRTVLADGVPVRLVGTALDVTERRHAEQQVARLSRNLEQILGAVAEGVYEIDATGRITFVNPAAERILGWPAGALLGQSMHAVAHHSRADGSPFPEASCAIHHSARGSTSHTSDSDVFWRRDGTPVYVEYTSSSILEGGQARGAVVTFHDVTERLQIERSLRRQSVAIEASVDGIAVLSEELYFTFLNTAYARMYGYESPESLLGKQWGMLFGEEERERLHASALPAVAERRYWHGEATARRRDGAPLTQSLSVTKIPGGGYVCVVRDVSERNRAYEALRRSEERFRIASQSAIDLIYEWDIRTNELTWFGDIDGRLGYEPGEFPRTLDAYERIIHPEDRDRVMAAIARHLRDREPYSQEYRILHKDGTCRYWAGRGTALYDATGAPVKWIGVTTDITERKETERVLLEAEQRAINDYERLLDRLAYLALAFGTSRDLQTIFRTLRAFALQSIPCNGIFISLYDAEHNARSAVYAWSEGEEIDVSHLPPMPMSDSPNSRAVLTGKVIVTDDFQAEVANLPVVHVGTEQNPDLPQSALAAPMSIMGRVVGAVEIQSTVRAAFKEEHVTAIRMAANLAAIAVENIRLAEREAERGEQLRQSQKMEAVGQLAGGVAHDFNNLLTVITGYSDMLCRQLKPGDPLLPYVEEIAAAGERAAALTRQLLAFSRRQVLQPKVLDLNTTVSEMEKMLRRLIGEDIELVIEPDPDLGRVKADPGQIEQVILNLAVNARDAMPDGGTIAVRTANVMVTDTSDPDFAGLEPGPHVMLAVSDTGCGMDYTTQARIFEPFFTTKEQGKGTGLGLSTVYGIITQSKGRIKVDSAPGHGATFTVLLRQAEEVPEEKEAAGVSAAASAASETVLLVEDEDAVRQLARRLLLMNGYTVLEARDGEEALALGRSHPKPIDVVLTDVVMPRMSGRELVERLAPIRPEAKVIYMSGYTDDAIARHDVFSNGTAFLEKPFAPHALAAKVREVLDATTV